MGARTSRQQHASWVPSRKSTAAGKQPVARCMKKHQFNIHIKFFDLTRVFSQSAAVPDGLKVKNGNF
jgi:hypothetical protein